MWTSLCSTGVLLIHRTMKLPDNGYILLESIIPLDECSLYISLLNNHAAAANTTTCDSNTASDGSLTTGDSKINASSEPRHHKANHTQTHLTNQGLTRFKRYVALAVPQVLNLFRNKHILSEVRLERH